MFLFKSQYFLFTDNYVCNHVKKKKKKELLNTRFYFLAFTVCLNNYKDFDGGKFYGCSTSILKK